MVRPCQAEGGLSTSAWSKSTGTYGKRLLLEIPLKSTHGQDTLIVRRLFFYFVTFFLGNDVCNTAWWEVFHTHVCVVVTQHVVSDITFGHIECVLPSYFQFKCDHNTHVQVSYKTHVWFEITTKLALHGLDMFKII